MMKRLKYMDWFAIGLVVLFTGIAATAALAT